MHFKNLILKVNLKVLHMKKLETLDNEKFQISEDELNQIKGGYSSGTRSLDESRSYYYTQGGSLSYNVYDYCVYYD